MKPILAVALAGGLFLSACAVPSGGALDRAAVEGARADLCEGAAQTALEAQIWSKAKERPADKLELLSVLVASLEARCDPGIPATNAGNAFIPATVARIAVLMAKN